MRILPLQDAQSKPVPPMDFPDEWNREQIYKWFVPFQYWAYTILYFGYLAMLGRSWFRAIRERRSFEHALLLAVVFWGAIFFLRTLGRSDEHHLTSALPPACLVLAHLIHRAFQWLWPRVKDRGLSRTAAELTLVALVFALWVILQGSDLYLSRELRGTHPLASLDGAVLVHNPKDAARIDEQVRQIIAWTEPGDTFLDLTNAPMLHVLTGRSGPGYSDVITPGVFDDEAHETAFVERLEASPPALVIWPSHHFDWKKSRSLAVIAPRTREWVLENYEAPDKASGKLILRRLDRLEIEDP